MKLLKIKWENITIIIFAIFFIYCIITHIIRNGFNFNVIMFEIFLYGLVLTMNYVAIKYVRKDFLKERD